MSHPHKGTHLTTRMGFCISSIWPALRAARDVAVHGAERMKEAREINMSLSVLKDCIRGKAQSDALANSSGPKSRQKKVHVPFRQSALTRILKHVFDPC